MEKNIERNVLIETLELLKTLYAQEGLESGHLKKIAVKPQWNAVIATRDQCGIAINFTGIHSVYEGSRIDPEAYSPFIGKNLLEVAEKNIVARDISLRSLGVAALSALSQPFLTPEFLQARGFQVQERASGPTEYVSPSDGVAIVGYGGMVRALMGKCRALHVTDMRPPEYLQNMIIGETVEYGPETVSLHSDSENEDVLGKADVVFITGSTLVNDTFEELIGYCDKTRRTILYGPSASFIPDVLFERGVDLVLNTRLTDPERFEYDAVNDMDMEFALKRSQSPMTIGRKAV